MKRTAPPEDGDSLFAIESFLHAGSEAKQLVHRLPVARSGGHAELFSNKLFENIDLRTL